VELPEQPAMQLRNNDHGGAMFQEMVTPESDPLDATPAIRCAIDPRDYEFRSPKVIALAVVLVLSGVLWAAIGWGLVTLVDVIYHLLSAAT
jgi:hypothetical protein